MTVFKISHRQITLALHILIWSALLLLPWLLRTPGESYDTITTLPAPFFLLTVLLHAGLFYSNAFFFYPRLCNKRRWWLYLLCFILLVIAGNALKATLLQTWYPEIPLYGVNARFIFAPTFFALLAGTVYRFAANRINAEKAQKEKQSEQLAMQLKFLRSQVSPHFLFNVLANLVSLARKKSDRLEPSLIMLSDLMRYMLYDSDDKKVSLEKEAGYLKSYIALQQLRFGHDVDIRVAIELPADADRYRIEPMLLIPFVENAFKHGVGWIKDPRIGIALNAQEGQLSFRVENKFNPADNGPKDASSGIGLANVKSRLLLLYPQRHRLAISQENDTFHVHLTLQLQ
ncbi:sensor histidine kinase [Compostibacter hankyongensis]|uniref:Signal transduction histidine kinase internal region domain-containing protein n=1 Tax=Compostibacter hankyongensis TaxID=1007089 RepID=A0ABP8G7M6_9BACT